MMKLLTFLILWPFCAEFAASKDFPGESVFHLKGSWTNADGIELPLSSHIGGKLSVLAMIYTSCEYSCPLIIQEMNKIKKKVSPAAREKMRYVLVSMDPARDKPELLKKFASKRKLETSEWILLTAKGEGTVRELSTVLGINYKKTGKDFAHSNLITILDGNGVILYTKANLGQQIEESAKAAEKAAATPPSK